MSFVTGGAIMPRYSSIGVVTLISFVQHSLPVLTRTCPPLESGSKLFGSYCKRGTQDDTGLLSIETAEKHLNCIGREQGEVTKYIMTTVYNSMEAERCTFLDLFRSCTFRQSPIVADCRRSSPTVAESRPRRRLSLIRDRKIRAQ